MSNFRFGPNVSASDKWGRSTKRRRDCQAQVSASYIKGECIEYAVDVQLRNEGDGMTPQWLSLRMTPDAARELAASLMSMADTSEAQRSDPKGPRADNHCINEATAVMEREAEKRAQATDNATARPWQMLGVKDNRGNICAYSVWPDLDRPYLDSPRGNQIVRTPDGSGAENKANAALIVRAVNAHDKLHDIAIGLSLWFQQSGHGPTKSSMFDESRTWGEVVKSALAKAEGGAA